jgi:hypothetical protein
MDTIPDIVLANPGPETAFGYAIERLGDINGDFFEDIAVCAPAEDGYRGRVYIYYGGSPMDSIPDVVLEGESAGDRFGFSIAGLGDVNDDGEVDILVGAPGFDDYRGKAYMYTGSRAGVRQEDAPGHLSFTLQAGPNPTSGDFTISYKVSEPDRVRIDLFDVTGRLVTKISDRWLLPGDYVLDIDLTHDPAVEPASGIYFLKVTAAGKTRTAKLVVLK